MTTILMPGAVPATEADHTVRLPCIETLPNGQGTGVDTLLALWLASIVAAVWFLTVGAIRFLAYRAGTDHTPGMRTVAVVALVLGGAAVLTAVGLGVVVVPDRW